MISYLILILGFFKALADFGIGQAIAFALLWMLFGPMMFGIPSIIGMLRTLSSFTFKEFMAGLAAQALLIAILYGIIKLVGIEPMLSWFIIGGIIVGFTAPQRLLNEDRSDRLGLNQNSGDNE